MSYSQSTSLNHHRHRLLVRLTVFCACSFGLGLAWASGAVQRRQEQSAARDSAPVLPLQSSRSLEEKEAALGAILDDLAKRRQWTGQLERYVEHLKAFASQYHYMPGCLVSDEAGAAQAPSADSLRHWFASLLSQSNLQATHENDSGDGQQDWQQFVDRYQAYAKHQAQESFSWTPPALLFGLPTSALDKLWLKAMAWTQIWPLSQCLSSSQYGSSRQLVHWLHKTVAPAAKAAIQPHAFSLSILELLPPAHAGPEPASRLGLSLQCLKEVWNDAIHWPQTCHPTLPLLFDAQFSDSDFVATMASAYGLDASVLGSDVYTIFNDLYLKGAESYQLHWIVNEWKMQPLLFLHDTSTNRWTSSPLRFVFFWKSPRTTADGQDRERRWRWLSRMHGLVDAIRAAELGQVWIVNLDGDAQFSSDWKALYSK